MAVYWRRTVSTKRVEYVLPNPTNWAEYAKACAGIRHELGEHRVSDDMVTISATDDEIVLSYQADQIITTG